MKPETLLACVQAFNSLIGTKYHIHLGHAGKLVKFTITIEKEDAYHLMGLHYLQDRIDNRNRGKIFDALLTAPRYRQRIASSLHWSDDLSNRVACVSILEKMLDDNSAIFRYNPKHLYFHSHILAEYLLAHKEYPVCADYSSDVYLFIDKRDQNNESSERFCKSIFTKRDHDFTECQAKWALLYKEKVTPNGTTVVLYKHNGYDPGNSKV